MLHWNAELLPQPCVWLQAVVCSCKHHKPDAESNPALQMSWSAAEYLYMLLVLNRVKLPPEALVRPTAFWTCLGRVTLMLSKPRLPEAGERTAFRCTCLTAPGSLARTASWCSCIVLCAGNTAQPPSQTPRSVQMTHHAPVLSLQFVLRHQKFNALTEFRGAYWQLLSDRDVRMLPWLEAFQVRDEMAQPLPGLLFGGQLL